MFSIGNECQGHVFLLGTLPASSSFWLWIHIFLSCFVVSWTWHSTRQQKRMPKVHRKRFLKSSNSSSLHPFSIPLNDSYQFISHSHHSPVPHLVTLGLILNRIRLLMFFQVCWLVHDVFRPRHHSHHDTGAKKTWHGIATRHPCASGINGMVPRSGRPLSWKALKDVKRCSKVEKSDFKRFQNSYAILNITLPWYVWSHHTMSMSLRSFDHDTIRNG